MLEYVERLAPGGVPDDGGIVAGCGRHQGTVPGERDPVDVFLVSCESRGGAGSHRRPGHQEARDNAQQRHGRDQSGVEAMTRIRTYTCVPSGGAFDMSKRTTGFGS